MRKILLDVNASVIKPTTVIELFDTDEDESEIKAEQIYSMLIDNHADMLITDDIRVYEILKNTGANIHYLTN